MRLTIFCSSRKCTCLHTLRLFQTLARFHAPVHRRESSKKFSQSRGSRTSCFGNAEKSTARAQIRSLWFVRQPDFSISDFRPRCVQRTLYVPLRTPVVFEM